MLEEMSKEAKEKQVNANAINATSKKYDRYCCRIMIQRGKKIGPIIVEHILRKLLSLVFTSRRCDVGYYSGYKK